MRFVVLRPAERRIPAWPRSDTPQNVSGQSRRAIEAEAASTGHRARGSAEPGIKSDRFLQPRHPPLSGRGILIHLYEDKARSVPHSGLVDVRRLLLVDDYRMVTEALASRLSAAPDLWVAGGCTTDDPQLPEVVRWLRPDVILIEVEPLGFAVGEVLQRLRAAWPAAHGGGVSGDHDVAHAVDAARAGAAAWVSQEQGADELETVL